MVFVQGDCLWDLASAKQEYAYGDTDEVSPRPLCLEYAAEG